jgi:hypothetical protein
MNDRSILGNLLDTISERVFPSSKNEPPEFDDTSLSTAPDVEEHDEAILPDLEGPSQNSNADQMFPIAELIIPEDVPEDVNLEEQSTEALPVSPEAVNSEEQSIEALPVSPEAVSNPDQSESEVEAPFESPLIDENPLPSAEERTQATRNSLNRKGFILDEDVRGLRLSSVTTRSKGPGAQLSAYDIVRLAADLEGGIIPVEQRKHCPKCNAVVSPGDKRCQWCSEVLDT